MRVLEGLWPQTVFYYFEEICKIPHGSGNTRMISDYLVSFAQKRKLEYYQDDLGNVIIIKPATAGYEEAAPVMLQGHMDMVAVKQPDCKLDMEKEGLQLQVMGDMISAKGTSLGGDDGIALAYGLAVLADESLKHPRLELVITVDEEVGMDGARAIDLTPCRAKTLINLDSEEEGIFWAGCAGGARVNCYRDYLTGKQTGEFCKIKISGLTGGHSGAEIHKERGNACILLVRALRHISQSLSFALVSLKGGLADNAIPRTAEAEILLDNEYDKLQEAITLLQEEFAAELADKDAQVLLEAERIEAHQTIEALSHRDTIQMLHFLCALPNGVQAMSSTMPGLVETSLNLGILQLKDGKFSAAVSVRSSYQSAKKALIERLQSIAHLAGVQSEISGDYPGWVYQKDSPLQRKMIALYQKMYEVCPKVEAIHAGLECGIFADKIKGLDCVSIGPDMKNIHTTEEELSISSSERVYLFLVKLLEEMR